MNLDDAPPSAPICDCCGFLASSMGDLLRHKLDDCIGDRPHGVKRRRWRDRMIESVPFRLPMVRRQ